MTISSCTPRTAAMRSSFIASRRARSSSARTSVAESPTPRVGARGPRPRAAAAAAGATAGGHAVALGRERAALLRDVREEVVAQLLLALDLGRQRGDEVAQQVLELRLALLLAQPDLVPD